MESHSTFQPLTWGLLWGDKYALPQRYHTTTQVYGIPAPMCRHTVNPSGKLYPWEVKSKHKKPN
jgi:hypothetical protein